MQVDASFNVNSVPNPISSSGGGEPDTSSATSSKASNARLDAIIGVCSALGGIALMILGFLLYRNFKRRREMAHRRLSDPVVSEGVPAPGHQFDRDSVGGQRRRSFYFAEDSLRGYVQAPVNDEVYDHRTPAGGMRERRTIVPGTISAPILRDNTLNW